MLTVHITTLAGKCLMWCNSCGPLGVSPDLRDAMMVTDRHYDVHGVTV